MVVWCGVVSVGGGGADERFEGARYNLLSRYEESIN